MSTATAPVVWQNRIVGYAEVAPDQLLAHFANVKIHPDTQTQAIKGILGELGWIDSVKVSVDSGRVIDGHDRVKAAMQTGQATVPVTYIQLTEQEELYALATFDPVGALAATDSALLADLLADVQTGDAAVAALLESLRVPVVPMPGNGGDEFDGAAQAGPTRCQPGDLWAIGPHRLLCGDSTEPNDIARLMQGERATLLVTDPPYGVAYSGRGQSTQYQTIENDDLDLPALKTFLLTAFTVWDSVMAPGGVVYVCHADRPRGTRPIFEAAFTEAGWNFSATLIWVKQQAGMGFQDYRAQHEPILYGWKPGAAHYYCGDRAQTTIWEVARDSANSYEHPTQKPIELAARAIRNSSKPGDIVADAFGGGGWTLIAAHRESRQARLMEIAPPYADVILRRAEAEGIGPIARVGDG